MLTILFYILTLFSYNHPPLVEAQITPSLGFTIDLFHRYSPKSPFYNSSISLTQRLYQSFLDSASRHHYLKWVTHDSKIDSDISLIPNQGDYLMKVLVGTPPVELTAVVSTASDLTWFQCQPCQNCYKQNTTIFNPTLSSTYKRLPCDSMQCSNLDTRHLHCDQMSKDCSFWYSYGNGSIMTRGVMGTDSFSFLSPNGTRPFYSFPVFGCGHDQYGQFDHNSTGVVGLDSGPLSLVTQLGPSFGFKFSYCLASSTSEYTSKLRFGRDVETGLGVVTSTPYATMNTFPSLYSLNLTGISIDIMSVQVNTNIVIDIATSLTYLNPSIFSKLKAMVNEALGMQPLSQPPNELLCYDKRAEMSNPPDIVLHFSGGDLKLRAYDAFFVYNGFLCLSMVMSEHDGDPMVLGNMAQVNLEVVYDLQTKMVAFAHKDCAYE